MSVSGRAQELIRGTGRKVLMLVSLTEIHLLVSLIQSPYKSLDHPAATHTRAHTLHKHVHTNSGIQRWGVGGKSLLI